MSTTAKLYGLAVKHAWLGDINFTDGNVKAAILTSSYIPNQDTDEFWSDISGDEVSGTGYDAGGLTVTSPTVTYTAGTNVTKVDCTDPSWDTSTITGRTVVFYYDSGSAATSPLICYQQSSVDIESSAGTWSFEVDPTGLFTDTAA